MFSCEKKCSCILPVLQLFDLAIFSIFSIKLIFELCWIRITLRRGAQRHGQVGALSCFEACITVLLTYELSSITNKAQCLLCQNSCRVPVPHKNQGCQGESEVLGSHCHTDSLVLVELLLPDDLMPVLAHGLGDSQKPSYRHAKAPRCLKPIQPSKEGQISLFEVQCLFQTVICQNIFVVTRGTPLSHTVWYSAVWFSESRGSHQCHESRGSHQSLSRVMRVSKHHPKITSYACNAFQSQIQANQTDH